MPLRSYSFRSFAGFSGTENTAFWTVECGNQCLSGHWAVRSRHILGRKECGLVGRKEGEFSVFGRIVDRSGPCGTIDV